MDAVVPRLSDRIGLRPRYVRSINIERDLYDPQALDGYVLSDSPSRALSVVLNAFRPGSTQRAVRVTGPYGSGKSALGLFITKLVCPAIGKISNELSDDVSRLIDFDLSEISNFVPLIVTGRRTRLSQAIAGAIVQTVNDMSGRGRKPAVIKLAKHVLKNPSKPADETSTVTELFDSFCGYVEQSIPKSKNRVLLVIDELGRFIEYAALAADQVDPAAFQIIAEKCAGKGKHACLALVHSGSAIISSSNDELNDWWKVAERFEDIPLHGSAEQSLVLLSRALVHKKTDEVETDIVQIEDTIRQESISKRLLPEASQNISFFPLHPTVLYLLSAASRKLRQNERSFFGFLQSGEAHGFQEFLVSQPYASSSWYRLPNLATYLLGVSDLDHGDNARRHRWELLRGIVEEGVDFSEFQRDILKTIGVINLLEPLPLLPTDEATISSALGRKDVAKEVKNLIKSGRLHRRHDNTLSVWDSTLVDLTTLRTSISKTIDPSNLEAAFEMASDALRPLVAQRHYHTKGTLRFFSTRFSKLEAASSTAKEQLDESDGAVVIVILRPRDSLKAAMRKLVELEEMRDSRVFVALKRFSPAQLDAARELLIWGRALESTQELQFDDLARDEVRRRYQAARILVGDWSAADSESGHQDRLVWLHKGSQLVIESRRDLQKFLSDAADETFHSAPTIRNELINRTHLSSAVAAARNRLVRQIFESHGTERLGIDGTPPEYAIYLSLFHASGVHRSENGNWGFAAPLKKDPHGWKNVWKAVDKTLSTGKPATIANILLKLRCPPFGLRRDVALLFLMAYLKANDETTVLLEEGLLVLQPNDAVFMRIVKSVDSFSLHRPPHAGESLKSITDAVNKVASTKHKSTSQSSFTESARGLYRWYNGLPRYAQGTRSISKNAQQVRAVLERASDPVELISRQLPAAVFGPTDGRQKNLTRTLGKALQEIDEAYDRLFDQISTALIEAFAPLGDISRIRRFVKEMEPCKRYLEDYRLKAVIERSVRADLDDLAWVHAVASTITGIDPANWTDAQLDTFKLETRRMADQLGRWHALARQYDLEKGEPSEFISIVAIDLKGNEAAFSVPGEVCSHDEARKITEKIRKLICNRDDGKAILTQLLIESLAMKNEGNRRKK